MVMRGAIAIILREHEIIAVDGEWGATYHCTKCSDGRRVYGASYAFDHPAEMVVRYLVNPRGR